MAQEGRGSDKGADGKASAGARDQVSAPAISLPKGGGAIRGMGEKFGVTPATGTGSLTIPLASSPGRSGFGPQLSLSYDSGSGNGPFGFGWSLSLPAITRKTDKGLPRYLDADESDVFLISGAEDLVPVLDNAGNRVALTRTVHGVAYEIHVYRPRIEGLFTRVERWTRADDGVSHWRTITRDNVTTLFGFDEHSRVSDSHDARRVFSYLIHLTFDDKGNAVHYEYASEDSAGVNTSRAHETNRTDAGRATQRYLKHVRYGNFEPYFPDWSEAGADTPLPGDWHFQMVFDYGDHRTDAPTPARNPALDPAWPVRPDPFSIYRAGFEVRTYRRCKRVLMFHNFADEAGVSDGSLVRSTDFGYSDEATPADPRNPIYTFMKSVTQTGYRPKAGGYEQRSTPPLEFFYSEPEIYPEILTLDDAEGRANLPEGLDGARFRLVDLDGEGLSGILTEQDGGWGYKRNLSPTNEVELTGGERVARARFGPLEQVPTLPVPAHLGGGQQLLDLTGEGRPDAVTFDGPVPGFFARTAREDWEPLKTFASLPRIDWSEPNLKFVDLTGDGRADVLITADDLYTFYPSLGAEGFGEAERVFAPSEEARGPRVVFADGTRTVSTADMTGDGLGDLVRVRNGEVCYWPNLGYGRFGAKVTMDDAPRFTDEERFDARRVHLVDVDGSGTTDILYVGDDGVRVYFNRSGNSWAEAHLLAIFPGADDPGAVQVADLLGNGTACLVWSSPLPAEAYAPLRYVDLMGSEKPHLMVRTRNNLGAETRVSYAPSTRFYLEDKQAGRPWVTRLPFPVHVVERVETYDWISRSRFVARYAYHHGHFDGAEREFRGFGMVEQRDTEAHREDTLFPEASAANEDAASFVPPTVTRTWFHTGAFVEAGIVSRQYAHEYWFEPALGGDAPAQVAAREAMLLPDTVIEDGFDAEEMREAYRALKGMALRVEVYAEDGTPRAAHPYTVTEQNYSVRRLQRRGPNRHAVFLAHPRESLIYHYERRAADPRLKHDLTLEVDDFGNARRSVSVCYGRRAGYPEPEPDLSASFRAMLAHDQTRPHVAATEHAFTAPFNRPSGATTFDAYRAPLPSETITAELTGVAPAAARFGFDELDNHWTTLWGGAHDIAYEDVSTADIEGAGAPAPLARRVIERTRTLYRRDDLSALLPLHSLASRALPGESYHLALTPGLVARIFSARVPDAVLLEGGYVRLAGELDWWIPSGRVFYSPGDADTPAAELVQARAHFFQVRRVVDPFGAVNRVTQDPYDLLPLETIDALGNTTAAVNDYRVLQPSGVTDPNGNVSRAAFDCLGRLAGTAVGGKAGEGDSLAGFVPDPSDAAIRAVLDDPLDDPGAILGDATSRIIYDLFAYSRTRDLPAPEPVVAYSLARETHVSELAAGQTTRFRHLFAYSDGFGREAQHKAQAEPGAVVNAAPRWVGSGWTIYNNKGKPVRKYEPFFTPTHRFEFAPRAGASSVLCYDPVERVVATVNPDSTFQKTVFDAWRHETWDANDTALIADPRADADVGDFFGRLFGDAPGAFTSWHDRRVGGTLGNTPDERAANRDAAQKTAAHAATPAAAHLDSLGRVCLNITDNGMEGGTAQRFPTRVAMDAENKPLCIFDATGRRAVEFCLREPSGGGGFRYVAGYDVAGNPLYRNGMDGGERRTLNNVAGHPLRSWDARGSAFEMRYDALRRPTHRFVERAGSAKILLERSVYGERHPDATRNLKGKLFRHYDGAGVAGNERYDFKGNLLEATRQLARLTPATVVATTYDTAPDWTPIADLDDSPALDLAALNNLTAPLVAAADSFTTSTRFDALNRPLQVVTPHAAAGRPSVIQTSYNEAGLLERVDVWVRQAAAPSSLLDPASADIPAVRSIDYNARGQRTSITLGNRAATSYEYDPETFRLSALTTTRPDTFAADARTVQALAYHYDAVGNVTRLRDSADIQNVVYFSNRRVEPSADYTYDPAYRLTAATGREHLGQTGGALNASAQATHDDGPRTHSGPNTRLLNPGDGNAMGNYTEQYAYDPAGNLLQMIHQVASGGWTRRYSYAEPSRVSAAENGNRLSATSLPGDDPLGPFSATYLHDEHGNMTRMSHLPGMTWDADDHLQSTARQVVNSGMPETTYYAYDAGGERLRKATYAQAVAGATPGLKSERLYLGVLEIFREYDGAGNVVKERETVHVMDDKQRVALVETRTAGAGPAQLIRYQHANHLGSAVLELDDAADLITYEEYFPFGSTSYQAARTQTETPKRYRYTGKERDEENDLYYHGARYYACWLGRWASCDPAGTIDGTNLYRYCRNCPTRLTDPSGTQGHDPDPQPQQQPTDPPSQASVGTLRPNISINTQLQFHNLFSSDRSVSGRLSVNASIHGYAPPDSPLLGGRQLRLDADAQFLAETGTGASLDVRAFATVGTLGQGLWGAGLLSGQLSSPLPQQLPLSSSGVTSVLNYASARASGELNFYGSLSGGSIPLVRASGGLQFNQGHISGNADVSALNLARLQLSVQGGPLSARGLDFSGTANLRLFGIPSISAQFQGQASLTGDYNVRGSFRGFVPPLSYTVGNFNVNSSTGPSASAHVFGLTYMPKVSATDPSPTSRAFNQFVHAADVNAPNGPALGYSFTQYSHGRVTHIAAGYVPPIGIGTPGVGISATFGF
ncbi:MAG TPA: SpvB/TcaC N-terminal domain-containing protein [Pyrinomonadaceae bacterium]|jgi:RHS repeat-associated protein